MNTPTFRQGYAQGYGAPDLYWVEVIYDNRLLECVEVSSAYAQGVAMERLRNKWASADIVEAAKDAPFASPVCDHCGKDTLDGVISTVNKTFCKRCEQVIPLCKEAYQAKQREAELHREEQQRLSEEERLRRLADAQTGFHWRDGWFFKRGEGGSVRVSHVSQGWLSSQVTIPENEWASIVCSVSAKGETGERWQWAREFHA